MLKRIHLPRKHSTPFAQVLYRLIKTYSLYIAMILSAETDLFPDSLFEQTRSDDGRAWWLAHTKPRQEKALARDLLDAEFPFFLPCSPVRKRIRNRVVTSYIPLFSGYAFVRVTPDERPRVYAGNRVARLVPVLDQDRLWSDLDQVHKLLTLGEPIALEDRLQPGTPVTIRSGPLIGLTGTIVRATAGHKFVVQVNLIQRGVSVTVDSVSLGKLG